MGNNGLAAIPFLRTCPELMVSQLVFRSRGPGLSPSWGHYVVLLGKIFYSLSGSLKPSV